MASRRFRQRRGVVVARVLRMLAGVVEKMPLARVRRIGGVIGWLAWLLAIGTRRRALHNIATAFPEWNDAQTRQTIRAMFRHLGTTLMEFLWLRRLDAAMLEKTTVLEGVQPTLDAIASGRGAVFFTGHCGNWEWSAVAVAARIPLTVLQRERDEQAINQLIVERRAAAGMHTIDRGSASSARELLAALRSGRVLAFLIDQNIRAESVKVPFFGQPALTPIGPAKLAIRTESVAVTVLGERHADGSYTVHFGTPIPTSRDDDPVALTERVTAEIEAQIRRVPEQWVWMHDRWRERPRWDMTEFLRPGDAR